MCCSVFFLLFLSVALIFPSGVVAQGNDPVLLGSLSELAHDVSGEVYAEDTRTLQIRNFNYDGLGPAGVFWVDEGEAATGDGRRIAFKESCEVSPNIDAFSGAMVRLELPPDITLADIGYFSVWCQQVDQEFGGIRIDQDVVADLPVAATADCADPDASEMSEAFPVLPDWNCEPLSGTYQVRWRIIPDEDAVDIELVARMSDTQYLGFGPSGNDEKTEMNNSDVVIAHRMKSDNADGAQAFSIVDYHMPMERGPCTNGVGVCPDTMFTTNTGTDSLSNTGGNVTEDGGVTKFSYRRPLQASDDVVDRPIVTDRESYLSWAIGPVDELGFPTFHRNQGNYPQKDVLIEWGRAANNACPRILESPGDDATTTEPVPGFLRPTLSGVTELTARIGPSGGERGIAGITGGSAWGIAWYLSPTPQSPANETDPEQEILIPAVAVERGKTYTFTVYGGRKDLSPEEHPLYITNSSIGGFEVRTPEERAQERIYAGINVTNSNSTGIYGYNATAAGALCKLGSSVIDTDNLTYAQFADTLDRSCEDDPNITAGGVNLTWTVPSDAEDIVYYQCVTHRFLGYKLVVFDEGQVDLERLERESGGAKLAAGSTTPKCRVEFQGKTETFAACDLDTFKPFELYYTVGNDGITVDTLFRAPNEEGVEYAAFSWGYSTMISENGNNAMIAYKGRGASASPTISNWKLSARSTAGVTPAKDAVEVSDELVDVTDEYISGRFSRKLEAEGLPTLVVDGDTPVIWAYGASSDAPDSSDTDLQQHSRRGTANINLASGMSSGGGGVPSSNLFRAHSIVMSIAWVVLVPWAVIGMRFFKAYNPATFNVHRIVNSTAALLSVIGLLLVVFRSTLTNEAHRFVGYVVVGLSVLQVAGGIFRPHKEKEKIRMMWYVGHAGLGSSALILGTINVFLGIGLGFFTRQTLWNVLAGIAVGLAVTAFFVFSALPRRFPTIETKKRGSQDIQDNEA